jgi:hypothetical protein
VKRARYEADAYVEADLPFLRWRFATLDAAVAAIVERIDTPLYFPTWLALSRSRPTRACKRAAPAECLCGGESA